MEEVEAVINSQELRKKVSENKEEEHGDGLMARGRSTQYARKDYPERKGKKKDNFKTADARVVEDNFDGVDVPSVTISSSNGGWILDTSCSYHMCANRDWFATYRSFEGGKVLMGNDVACKGSTITGATTTASSFDIDSDITKLWHMRLGHMSEICMDVLSKQGLLGSKKTEKLDFCEHCVFEKQCMVKFSRAVHTTKGTKEELIDAGKDHGVREKVELDIRKMILILPKRMNNLRNNNIVLPETNREEKFDFLRMMLSLRNSNSLAIFALLSGQFAMISSVSGNKKKMSEV
ncbi:hypothetical protein RJ640_015082 [Escallonia rubra]|uniref:GAG-pre-integrase domain-containing protein n=1 Tax=Escallonia rubra TaxID=112253 RepID=A0AA88UE37_9ASTE|nr:hypothetical protein RJ640_015082 [Escallonia rubra]